MAGKYKREVGTVGTTIRQYQCFNWQSNDPGFLSRYVFDIDTTLTINSRTEILPTPPSLPGKTKQADPVSVALAYKKLKEITELGIGINFNFM